MDPSALFGALIDYWPVSTTLGCVVLFVGWKKLSGRLRVFVMLAGASIVGFLLAAALHNALWWLLFVKLFDRPAYDEPLFFIIAVIVCPVAFLVGVVGAVVTLLRNRMKPAPAEDAS